MVAVADCYFLTTNLKTTERGNYYTIGIMQDHSVKEFSVKEHIYNRVKDYKPMTEIELSFELTEFKGQKGYNVVGLVPIGKK